ncbi:MAG TPA: transglutaminase domain-containing protein [Cyclobacteriaceae bacterium]|nr:transglutaminase domain-containing protein [Cyclobacteriaceae bacterium]
MTKNLKLLAILSLATFTVIAQKAPIKFGEIPLADLKMTTYGKDTSAAAVILTDYGEAYINFSSLSASLIFERHVRIKILKKEGTNWANVEIPLYHVGSGEERVSKLKASTYNLDNGKIVESSLSKDGIFKEKFNRNINLQKFTLPNVKEGSVIEYSYTIYSEFLTNFPNWQFQYDIPVQWSEYWAMLPEFLTFEKYMQGYIPPTTYEVKTKPNTGFQVYAHHYISKDVPAFKAEPFMTCENDYVSKINMALSHINFPGQPVREIMGTWSKLNTDLLESESFGKAVTGSGFLKKKAEELTSGITDPQKKVEAIYYYVKQNLEWDGTKDKYVDNLKKVIEDKKGTAADINITLASMLEKVNIPVDMVLISTRDHGFVRTPYPMEDQFNYVICSARVGDQVILLDATDKYLPINILPERCLNGQALVISRTNHGWINIEPKAKGRTVVNADLSLSETGDLQGKLTYSYEGYDAGRIRKDYFVKGEGEFLKEFLTNKTWEVEKNEFQNLKETNQAVKQHHEVIISEQAIASGDVIYINPLLGEQMKENLFKLENREYPVDFGRPIDKTIMGKITLPDGYVVDELPKPKIIILPNGGGKYTYNVTQTGNALNIVSVMSINKSLFVQEEYPYLREFYTQLVAKQAEQIVLKRK